MKSTAIRCWRSAVRSITVHWTRCLCGTNSGCGKRQNDRMLPAVLGWEDRPPRRAVDRTTGYIAENASRLDLHQGKPSIADHRFVIGQLRLDLVEQVGLQGGFARIRSE